MSVCIAESSPPRWKEADRLTALRNLGILDTEPEAAFDNLAKVAAHVCNAPIALVSLIDEQRQWLKCEIGLGGVRETAREVAICSHAIFQSDLFVVPDTTKDLRFRDNPLVTGDPHLRFYAGAPLITDEGLPLGTLCVLDTKPRPQGLTPEQSDTLLTLGRAVLAQLKLRKANSDLQKQEGELTALLDGLPQVVWSFGPEGGDDYNNKGWYEFTGTEPGSVQTEGWLRLLHPEDQQQVLSVWQHAVATGSPYEIEHRLRHHSGEYRWILARTVPLRDDQGRIKRWVGTGTDVHESKLTQQALAESEEFTRRLLSSSDDCIKVLDLGGSLLFMSEGGQRVMEVSDFCQIEGAHWPSFWNGPAAEEARAAIEIAKAGGTGRFQGFCPTIAKTPKWWDVLVTAIRGTDGQPERLLSISRDITELKRTEVRAAETAERYRLAAQATNDVIWDWDLDSDHIQWNEAVQVLFGYAPKDVGASGRWWKEHLHPEDRNRVVEAIQAVIDGDGTHWLSEYRFLRADGAYATTLDRGYVLRDEQGRAVRMVGAMLDLTERKRTEEALQASEERLRLALRAGRITALEMDLRTSIITRHQNTTDLLGIESSTLLEFMEHIHPDDQHKREQFFGDIEAQGASTLEFRYTLQDGQTRWFELHAEKTAPYQVMGLISDISDRKTAEQQLWRLANHDPLTGLPNRMLAQHKLEQALAQAKHAGTSVSLLVIDLDEFKDVNDSFGHDAGDALLKEIAARLSAATRDGDTVARLGGDEFVVLLAGSSSLEHAATLAEGIAKKLSQPVAYAGQMIASHASIGVATFPNHGAEAADLMKDADIALYRAKAEGRNRVVTYSPEMRAATEQRITLRREMREAIAQRQIVPFYQPKVCLSTGKIIGFEALARWHHPTKGFLTPATFGTVFDDPELAAQVGKRLIGNIAADMRRWRKSGLNFGQVAINLSHAEFIEPRLADDILRIFDLAKVSPKHLEIEITEKVLLDAKYEFVSSALEKFRSRGVQIALDDFGTGYASLTHLKHFQVDHIKIDRSFVCDLEEDPDDEAIVMAVVGLGRSLNLQVTAEGVETVGQAQRLREMGCGAAQGYLYAKPMAGSDVPEFLSGWTSQLVPAKRLLLVEG